MSSCFLCSLALSFSACVSSSASFLSFCSLLILTLASAISLALKTSCCSNSCFVSLYSISASTFACVPSLAASITPLSLFNCKTFSSASTFFNASNLSNSSSICSALNLFCSIAQQYIQVKLYQGQKN